MGLLDPARPNCSCIRNLLYLDDLQFKIVPAPLCSTDRNECNDGNAGCEHICTNTSGSFICSCDTGYQLDGNGLNCSGKVHLICIVSMSQVTSTPEQKKQKKNNNLNYVILSVAVQILTNVRLVMTTVMRRHSALTQRGVSPALVTLATLEMAQNVVWLSLLYLLDLLLWY